ncbi:MAG: hypothetical protein AAF598_00105 [Bacteroidota bacterium]
MKSLCSSLLGLLVILLASPFHPVPTGNTLAEEGIYVPTRLPADTTQLFIGDGDLALDTVFVIGEGGPKSSLDFEAKGRVYWEYMNRQSNYYFAVVHQASSLNPSIFTGRNFGESEALYEAKIATEILHRTISYFKTRGKYVIVTGHSYSAFLIPKYIADHGNDADRYLLTGGRLDADSMQTALQYRGINSGFDEAGKQLIVPAADEQLNPYRRARYQQIRRNKEWLKYATGHRKSTEELKGTDLSNLTSYFGLYDENVGQLTPQEIQFLEAHGATVKAVESDHYGLWKAIITDLDEGNLSL